jgi:hypothetical protein
MVQFSIVLVIVLIAIGSLVTMSLRANARYRDQARLPMQWALNGSVNWTAPRRIALSFTPVLATCVLTAVVVSTLVFEPRRGQEGTVIPAVLFMAIMFVGVHAFHLWLVRRTIS